MRLAIGVTREAHLARQPRLVAVTGVTPPARLMLRLRVQTGELTRLMARRARWRLRHAVRPVRAVTRQAALS